MEISNLNDPVHLPPSLTHKSTPLQLQFQFVQWIASQIVDECTLIDTCKEVQENDDKVYNYARELNHYCVLIIEFRHGWGDGNGDRMFRCWHLMLPHFKSSGQTKYSLEVLRLQFQVHAVRSPSTLGSLCQHPRRSREKHSLWPVQWACSEVSEFDRESFTVSCLVSEHTALCL